LYIFLPCNLCICTLIDRQHDVHITCQISFPRTVAEKTKVKESFGAIKNTRGAFGLDAQGGGCLGALDGSKITCIHPPNSLEEALVDRHGRHSINMQGLASPDLCFLDVRDMSLAVNL
jgi:hypothetical protein